MFKKITLVASAVLGLTLSALAQSGDNGQNGAWLPYWGDALGAANAGTNIATSTSMSSVTNTPVINIHPNSYITFYPSFNLGTNSAATSSSNVTFYFSVGPGTYTNGSGTVFGSSTMTTSNLTVQLSLGLTGTTNTIGAITISPTNMIGRKLQFIGASTAATNVGGINISNMPYFFWAQQ